MAGLPGNDFRDQLDHCRIEVPWEREALEHIRSQFPAYEPRRAWANFEFIADDGPAPMVELLVFTPQGMFLSEISTSAPPSRISSRARRRTS